MGVAGEMAQWFRALAPSTHMATHYHLTPVLGDLSPFFGLCGHQVHVVHRHMYRLNTHRHKNNYLTIN